MDGCVCLKLRDTLPLGDNDIVQQTLDVVEVSVNFSIARACAPLTNMV